MPIIPALFSKHAAPAEHLASALRHRSWVCALLLALIASSALADWRVLPPMDQRQPKPPRDPAGAAAIKPGDRWPADQKFRWLLGDLEIPPSIGKEPTA